MKLLLALVAARASKTCRHHRRLAAVTFNASTALAAAAPPVGNTTIALLSVGQPRGVLEHPVVVRQFRLMRSSLSRHDLFLALVGDGTLRKPTHKTAKDLKRLYGTRGLEILPKAAPPPCHGNTRMDHDSTRRFVAMVMHFRQGYRLVQKYEQRRGAAYDTIVKVRPDLIYFAPFPGITAVTRGVGHGVSIAAVTRAVAHGVMTRTGRFQRLNDHIFVCRRGACSSYFEHLPGLWDACDAILRKFTLPPQKYLFPDGEAENLLLDVPYTLVRPEPCVECHRVGGCSSATGTQDCRTKALLPHRDACHRLDAEMSNT